MLPEGDIDDLKRDPPKIPSCPGKSGQAGREISRDRRRVAENLGNEDILPSPPVPKGNVRSSIVLPYILQEEPNAWNLLLHHPLPTD